MSETYRYQLTEKEYSTYFRCSMYAEKGVKVERISFLSSVPLTLMVIFILVKPDSMIAIVAGVVASIAWLLAGNRMFVWLLDQTVRKQIQKHEKEISYDWIELHVQKEKLSVNGKNTEISNWYFLPGMLSLKCADGSDLLIPLRVFHTNQDATNFLKQLAIL